RDVDRCAVCLARPARRHRHDPRHTEAEDAAVTLADTVALTPDPEAVGLVARKPARLLRQAWRLWRTRIGVVLAGGVILIAIFGPYVAPHGPSDFVGAPYSSGPGIFGTDHLGQDVWSRFLNGGRSILWIATAATVLGITTGALGVPRWRILFSEVLPNVLAPLMVETSLRLTYAIALVASLAFLGFTPNPGGADWGLMIFENRIALSVQPWGVMLPIIAVGLLTLGTGLIGDGISRAAAGIDRRRGGE